jgi:hypothetical protein
MDFSPYLLRVFISMCVIFTLVVVMSVHVDLELRLKVAMATLSTPSRRHVIHGRCLPPDQPSILL